MTRGFRLSLRGAIGALSLTAVLATALVGCAPEPQVTSGPIDSGAPTTGESAEPEPAPAPVLVPGGSAADNLPYFTAVTAQVWASDERVHGRAYIDALAAAGFDKSGMQVTRDKTTVGNPAESIQFSVRWGETECLVGQVGPSTGEPVTAVLPQLGQGRCLIGETRAIDW